MPEKRLYTPKEFLTFIICGAPENMIGLLERHKITVLQLKKENVLSEIIKGLISDQSLGEIQVSDSVIKGKIGVELEYAENLLDHDFAPEEFKPKVIKETTMI